MDTQTATAVENVSRLTEILTSEELFLINNSESDKARQYVLEHLNEDERKVITTGCCDEVIIAIVDNMKKSQPERMSDIFLNYVVKPEWQREYILSQIPWITANEELTHECFSLERYRKVEQNHKRHRLFYLIKNPERFNQEWDEEYGGYKKE